MQSVMMNSNTQKAVKFLFETSFDEKVDVPNASAPEANAGITNAEVEDIRSQAFEAGRQDGLKEAHASIEATTVKILRKMDENIKELIDARREMETGFNASAARLAHAMATKLAPKLMEAHPLAEIENLIGQCLAELHDEPRLVVRLHAGLIPAMKESIDRLAQGAGYDGNVVLLGDENMDPFDCRVEWANGGVEHRLDSLVSGIEETVNRYLDTLTAETAENNREDGAIVSEQ